MPSRQDIWARLRLGLPVPEELNSKLLVLRGNDPTVLVVRECAHVMFIFRLFDLYSAGAVNISGTIERLKLSDAGLIDLSVLARACGSWHVGIEQLAVLALDLELKGRATVFSDKPPTRDKTEGIDRHFGDRPYSIGRDIALVELSCLKDVTDKLTNCSSKSLENVNFYWKASNQTSRVPLVFEFWSTARPFAGDSPATYGSVFGFTTEVISRAHVYGFDAYVEPQVLPLENVYRDASLEVSQEAVDFYGATRVLSNLIGSKMTPNFTDYQVTERCALIVVACIVLVPGRRHGFGATATAELSPYVALLVLAKAYSRVLSFYVAEERGCVKPAELQELPQGVRRNWQYMRSCLLAFLGWETLLVGFNVTLMLTAL